MATDFLTPADLIAEGRRVLRERLDPEGTGKLKLGVGSRLNTALSLGAAMLTPILGHVAERVQARTLSGATGADLDIVAEDLWRTTRKASTAALGVVYLQRSGSTATVIPAGSRFAVPASGTQQPVVFSADFDVSCSSTKVAVPVSCTIDGVVGNVDPSSITQIMDSLPDTGWVIFTPTSGNPGPTAETAAAPLGGGADLETDDELRARLRSVPRDVLPGTKAGVYWGAISTPGVASVVVVEPFDGTLRVFAGDAAFQLPDVLRESIVANLETWRGGGVKTIVRQFAVSTVPVSMTIYMETDVSNYPQTALKQRAQQAVLDYFAPGRPHPDEYMLDGIKAAVAAAVGDVQRIDLAAPTLDVKRLLPASYGAVSALPRYVTSASLISIALSNPDQAA